MNEVEVESDYEESTMNVIEHEPVPKPKSGVNNYRLGGRRPFMTIVSLMIGPVLNQVCGALYGVISTMWVSKALGTIGVSAVSTYSTFDMIGKAFGAFISVSASTKVSQLFGKGQSDEAGQVVCDLFRMCFLMGAIVPALLLPVVNICCRWFGANDEVVDLGFKYLAPILACSFLTCIYYFCIGLLQGEGRTMLIGIVAVISLCVAMFVFETIFLFVFKTGIIGAGFATVLGDAIPGIVLISMYFAGKFTIKANWRGIFKKFSPHTFPALRVGLSQLVSNLSISIPGIVMRKLIGMSVPVDEFNDAIAGYNMVFRYAMITNCVNIAVSMGFIPAASYAYASKQYKRFLRLLLFYVIISAGWSTFTNIFSWVIPREVSKVFGSDENYLNWAEKMLKAGNATGFIMFFRFVAQGTLQALQLGGQAMLITITSQLFAIIGFAFMLYYTDKNDAVRLCYAYPLSYAFGFVFGLIILIKPLYKVYKLYKETEVYKEDSEELPKDESKSLTKTTNESGASSSIDDNVASASTTTSSSDSTNSQITSNDRECDNIVEI